MAFPNRRSPYLIGFFTIVITAVVPLIQAQETNDAEALTSGSGVEDYPSWSPDGLKIAYAASEAGDVFGGNWDIWTVEIDGGAPKNLTADFEGDDRFPSWSPDGRQIGFWSEREGGGYFVIPASGGTLQRLATSASVPSSPPRWSADGRKLACMVRDDAGVFVEIATLPSGPIQRLPLPGKNTRRFDLSWSADGRFLACVDASSLTSHVSQVMVMNLEDETTGAVTDGWTSDWSPFWAGEALLFVSNRSGKKDLWIQGFEDGRPAGQPQQVTRDVGIRHAAISSDGARLAYSRGQTVANVWSVPILRDRPATWKDATQITDEKDYIEFIDLDRAGKRLLMTSDRSGNPDLWILELQSGDFTRVTEEPTPDWGPDWSPTEDRIAFYGYRSGNRDLWIMPSEAGEATQLTTDASEDLYPVWSPDGTKLAFYSIRSGNRDLWMISAAGGDARQLTVHPGDDLFPRWSPDGKWLSFYSERDGSGRLWRLPLNGGQPEKVTEGPGRFGQWSPDGEWILFTGWDERRGNIYAVSMKDKTERAVTALNGRSGSLGSYALAVGAERVFFTWEENIGDLWIVDIALPE